MKRILITGMNSYIGTSVEYWLRRFNNQYYVDTVDMKGDSWKAYDFSGYDAVFHVAGLAHADAGKLSKHQKTLYYTVNRDLTIDTAKKAKKAGVKQFIFMSSIIVYGDSAPIGKKKVITAETPPEPSSVYGDSKLQAENGILPLNDNNFHVVIIRPPMIYGRGCKGNYPILAKLARFIPAFPNIENERSILYIDNLCEFVRLIIEYKVHGIFLPQNTAYASTSQIVRITADVYKKRIWITPLLNWVVILFSHIPGKTGRLFIKAFGNLVYQIPMDNLEDQSVSFAEKYQSYQNYTLEESIYLTELKTADLTKGK